LEVVGVSKPQTTGSFVTKAGKKAYRGQRKHWYVYFYDDEGKFRKKRISQVQVPYYGSLIRRRKSYLCESCGTRFRSLRSVCPKCGSKARRLLRGSKSKTVEYPPKAELTPRDVMV
jgi:DNA-directed RNA polymerase subunit RPC12/RpoP